MKKMKKMKTKSSKKILPATVFAAIIVLSAFAVMCTTVSANGPQLTKGLDPEEGGLGTVVNVTIDNVTVGTGENVTVVDTLPPELTYIVGTFTVNDTSATPTVEKRNISYIIEDPGDYTIKFDVKVTEASWKVLEVCNEVAVYNETDVLIDNTTACFNISAFEELHKNVGIPKADVVFAIDLTGSMGDEIDEVKENATNIMDNLTAQIADVQFGLISFMDYDGQYNTTEPGSDPLWYNATYGQAAPTCNDTPYRLDLDITQNIALMNQTIAGLTIGCGRDGPQDYTRIIHESWNDSNLHWRDGAKRILILFGDNVPHDTNFDYDNNGTADNTGGDPGRDTILGTADDLDFEDEVANASAAGVHIMAVYSGWNVEKYPWTYMADETGGGYFELEEAEQIPDAIQDLIKAQALETLTIEEKNETQWAVVIDIVNPFSYNMTDTVITDRFGAEIEIDDPFPYEITQGTVSNTTTEDKSKGKVKGKPDKRKGTSKKVFLNWTIGDLGPGETARLILLVSTDLNPAGHQEYTTPTEPGEYYEMNSGATLKFIDPEQNMQLSAVTDSIYVTVLPEED